MAWSECGKRARAFTERGVPGIALCCTSNFAREHVRGPERSLNATPLLTMRQGARPLARSLAGRRVARCMEGPTAATPAAEIHKLGVPRRELTLEFTLPTGQSFRWRQTGAAEFTGVVGQRVVRLRQVEDDVEYEVVARGPDAMEAAGDRMALEDYFNLQHRVAALSADWCARDVRFAEVLPHFPGVRMLRQDPLETLFSFICSQNNNIARIHGLVERLCADYGTPILASSGSSDGIALGASAPSACEDAPSWSPAAGGGKRGKVATMIEGLGFFAFPTLEQLSAVTEESLRGAGYGYRAKYVVECCRALADKPGGGHAWLLGLREASYAEARAALCELPGVGPKVAACICLFALDKHEAVPVDTHVWNLAVTHYAPELAGKSLTPRLHGAVQAAFEQRFGPFCGWAHNTLFVSEIPAFRQRLPEHLRSAPVPKRPRKRKNPSSSQAAAEAEAEAGQEVADAVGA